MDYRHELKFLVSEQELQIIGYRLRHLMQPDAHHEEGAYTIRSLYFDDLADSCLQENEDGVDNRRKFRIRIYSGNDGVIKLEKKVKYRGMTRKFSEEISREQCLAYMEGKAPELTQDSGSLQKELFAEMKMNAMRPASIVEYERTAYIEQKGNVRITFDRNISGSMAFGSFLDQRISLSPSLPRGQHILEVKYDQFLPQYIGENLGTGMLQQISFSKYYYSRNLLL